jgi:hypothetical protein
VIWKHTSFNTHTSGEWAVTKTLRGYYAWFQKTLIAADPFATADAAKAACEQKAREVVK